MKLYLINPCNNLTSTTHDQSFITRKYRIWKPLGLLYIASLTPDDWDITIIDENREIPDYVKMEKPDLVGITSFTSQAERAYEIARIFRNKKVPVVMGGIHASMRSREAMQWVDAVVIGEAENVWKNVLEDFTLKKLKRIYNGTHANLEEKLIVKHNLLKNNYFFGSIQTTRGCPLNCSFCSVSVFNGQKYRFRPIPHIIQELKTIKEKIVLIVDDNFIGVNKNHINRAKNLLRAIIDAKIKKKYITQATLNIADDKEFLVLAKAAGLRGVFIGFETPQHSGLIELNKKFNIRDSEQIRKSLNRLRRHKILVLGSFIMGLDADKKGIGEKIARAALGYGVDILSLLFLTPLPGTRLWKKYKSERRIPFKNLPGDWKYFTFSLPVANYLHLSWKDLYKEMEKSFALFYSYKKIFIRTVKNLFANRSILNAFFTIVINFNYKVLLKTDRKLFKSLNNSHGLAFSK